MSVIYEEFKNLTKHRENFVIRDSQIEFSDTVDNFISTPKASRKSTSTLIEAGTGTGKSLAYLIPVIRSRQKTIISTNTKALQKQLSQELTNLQKHDTTISFKILQGAGNYACLLKAEGLQSPAIKNWISKELRNNQDGMIDTFKQNKQKFNKDLWSLISTDSSLCQSKCRLFNECFYQTAKKEAKKVNITVLNHDLLLLLYKIDSDLFKDTKTIVIDEAHQFPDKTRKTLSYSIRNKSLSRYINGLNWKLENVLDLPLRFDGDLYQDFEEEIFDFIPEEPNEDVLRIREFHPDLISVIRKIQSRIRSDADKLKSYGEKDNSIAGDYKRFMQLSTDLQIIFLTEDDNWIKTKTISKTDKNISQKIEAVPLNIGPLLTTMFSEKSVIMTSATLRDGYDFEFFKDQIDQPNAYTKYYPSPFCKKNVSVFIPKESIDPGDKENYHKNLTAYISTIHKKMNGRSLFLFTNKEDLNECKKLLPDDIRTQIYTQTHTSEIPHMIKTLQTQENVSLMGLYALWEGIDIVGQALSCVTVMRMPFSNPDDVIFSALKEKYRTSNNGSDYGFFDEYDLPQMLLKLKQGFGRLVRHENDTGLLALLDNRFMRKTYRNRVIELLEDYECYDDLDEAIRAIPKTK